MKLSSVTRGCLPRAVPMTDDGRVSEPDDLRSRASSIFERLRHGGDSDSGSEIAPEIAPSGSEDPPDPELSASPAPEPAGLAPADPPAPESSGLGKGANPGAKELLIGADPVPPPAEPPWESTEIAPVPMAKGDMATSDQPGEGANGLGRVHEALASIGDEDIDFAEAEVGNRHPGARAHPLPRRFAIANQKGGVGKTTTAVNLGAALAELDYRVLVVDLDPQGNATTGLGINGRNLDASIYDVILHDVPVEDVIEPTTLRNLFVVPATIDLAGAEIELVPVFSRELRLRRALESVAQDFDFVLIDCPPSLGLLTVNGLAAAGEVVVPIQCEYYALEGLGQLLRNVALVKANLNPDLDVSTIILTMYDARTRLAEQVVDEVRQHFGDKVCRNVVPRTVRLSEAPSFGQPIIVFDSSSRGSIAYRELAKEVSGGAPQRVR